MNVDSSNLGTADGRAGIFQVVRGELMIDSRKIERLAVGEVDSHSPRRAILSLFTNKWSASTIEVLECGSHRFGELKRELGDVSPKVLTQALRRLEGFGLVKRAVRPDVPLRVEYSLTNLGRGAADLLRYVGNWVDQNMNEDEA